MLKKFCCGKTVGTTNGFVFRLKVLPKCYSEYPLFIFTSVIIPISYWFQMWVVFSSLFPPPSMTYSFLFALGMYEMHNIEGNFLAILFSDTSVRGRLMPDEKQVGVIYCSVCQTFTPPRSFHCPSCNVCILKRDHHCMFTSCCIGHYNHRYFIHFMLHISVSVLFCFPFNMYFMWDIFSVNGFSFITSFMFPVVLFIIDLGPGNIDADQVYIILFIIEVSGLIFCASWLFFHLKLIVKGTILHEMRKRTNFYNMGRIKNIEMVFGKRWHLTWISPFISSELPCDGIVFPTRNENNSMHYQNLPENGSYKNS